MGKSIHIKNVKEDKKSQKKIIIEDKDTLTDTDFSKKEDIPVKKLYSDADGDGQPDIMAIDQNNDGLIDYIEIDTDGDGKADFVAIDTDFNGKFDTFCFDTDRDGKIDKIGYNLDEDGNIDYYENNNQ